MPYFENEDTNLNRIQVKSAKFLPSKSAKHLIKWKEEINLIIKLKYVHNDFALYVS